jgi:hypothetical protein
MADEKISQTEEENKAIDEPFQLVPLDSETTEFFDDLDDGWLIAGCGGCGCGGGGGDGGSSGCASGTASGSGSK